MDCIFKMWLSSLQSVSALRTRNTWFDADSILTRVKLHRTLWPILLVPLTCTSNVMIISIILCMHLILGHIWKYLWPTWSIRWKFASFYPYILGAACVQTTNYKHMWYHGDFSFLISSPQEFLWGGHCWWRLWRHPGCYWTWQLLQSHTHWS